MGYVKYTEEQLVERKMAQAAIIAARALLKSQREALKTKKEGVAQLRRELKAEIRNRKAKKEGVAKLRRELKAEIRSRKEAKLAFGRILTALRKVYKPYLAARRKLVRLRVAKRKAVLAADRKFARETAKAARAQRARRTELEYAASPTACEADKAYAADESRDATNCEVWLNYDGEANIDRLVQPVSSELPPAGTDADFEHIEFNENDFSVDVPPFAFCATSTPQLPRRSARLASHRPSPICV